MLCFLALPAWADTPSAMITSLNGSAMVITADGKHPAEPMMSLNPRTLIELREGASMSIVFFSRGSHERFDGPALIGIGKNRTKVFEGAEAARREVTTGSNLIKAIDPNALGETAPNGGLTASTSGDRTTVSWPNTTPGPYLISIYRPAHGKEPRIGVWAEELASSSVLYTGPKLDSTVTYVAEVKAGGNRIAATQFRVSGGTVESLGAAKAEAEEMRAANPSDTTSHVLMHTLYSQVGENEQAAVSLNSAMNGEGDEDAFVNRLNVMGKAVNHKANQDTAYAQAVYADQANWTFAPYWDPGRWTWDGWDDI